MREDKPMRAEAKKRLVRITQNPGIYRLVDETVGKARLHGYQIQAISELELTIPSEPKEPVESVEPAPEKYIISFWGTNGTGYKATTKTDELETAAILAMQEFAGTNKEVKLNGTKEPISIVEEVIRAYRN